MAIIVKINSGFLFGHKMLVVISLVFWVTFVFDSNLSMHFGLKSSFESYFLFFVFYGELWLKICGWLVCTDNIKILSVLALKLRILKFDLA